MNNQNSQRTENPAITWASLFVSALAQAGLDAVCICPGSRSTPLTLAFEAHPEIEVFLHLDERSAGFFALGRALATDKPVALVCTSGTAAANFYPAVIEAKMSQVPLLVLTTDRPPELRHSGANQTIDQVKMFGDHVLWAVDMDVPTAAAPAVGLRNVAQTAARAYHTAAGLVKGPVQVNFPFRKPLEPADSEQWVVNRGQLSVFSEQWAAQFGRGAIEPTDVQIETLKQWIQKYPRGIIVCGPRCPEGNFPEAVAAFSQATGYPIFADPLSGVRFGPWVEQTAVIGGYESFLAQKREPRWAEPQMVIRFGQVPTSKWLNDYLDRINPAVRLHVRGNGVWADDSHRTTAFWQVDEKALCKAISQRLAGEDGQPMMDGESWAAQILETERSTWETVQTGMAEEFFDVAAVRAILEALPEQTNVVMGNSLPIRHLDQFGQPTAKRLHIFGNRGASGIDGNTSTALGVASAADGQHTVLITGDVTFYHDLNGLMALRQNKIDHVTIVLLNNDGGGIFNRLPVAAVEPPFTRLFITPHGLDFTHAAALYGLPHQRIHDQQELQTILAAGWPTEPRLIEIMTDGKQDEVRRREIVQKIIGNL